MPNEQTLKHPPLQGLAKLMKQAFDGVDLTPLAMQLMDRAERDPSDANALMDLSTVMQLKFRPEDALELQAQALEIQQLYHFPAEKPVGLRLLALMGPGELSANTPLEFLVEGTDVSLTMLYVSPHLPWPLTLPEHDLLFVAANESEQNRVLLDHLARRVASWPRPVLNRPERIALTSREGTCRQLQGAPGVVMPANVKVDRAALEAIAREARSIDALLPADGFPIIVRPVDSHAGKGLLKLESPQDVAAYLEDQPEREFYVSPFVDYRGADGSFRKYRVALIGGRPFAVHMGVSDHWMIHYLNAGMTESPEKRAEEARWMAEFDADFAVRHRVALQAVQERMQLDYLILDCGETPDGRLLMFEVDTGAVIHAMDPIDLFPYKQPQMRKVFAAFREFLGGAAGPQA